MTDVARPRAGRHTGHGQGCAHHAPCCAPSSAFDKDLRTKKEEGTGGGEWREKSHVINIHTVSQLELQAAGDAETAAEGRTASRTATRPWK